MRETGAARTREAVAVAFILRWAVTALPRDPGNNILPFSLHHINTKVQSLTRKLGGTDAPGAHLLAQGDSAQGRSIALSPLPQRHRLDSGLG